MNRIQNLRKERDFEVTDKIVLKIQQHEAINAAISNNFNYICTEILADDFEFDAQLNGNAETVEIEERYILISIEKL